MSAYQTCPECRGAGGRDFIQTPKGRVPDDGGPEGHPQAEWFVCPRCGGDGEIPT